MVSMEKTYYSCLKNKNNPIAVPINHRRRRPTSRQDPPEYPSTKGANCSFLTGSYLTGWRSNKSSSLYSLHLIKPISSTGFSFKHPPSQNIDPATIVHDTDNFIRSFHLLLPNLNLNVLEDINSNPLAHNPPTPIPMPPGESPTTTNSNPSTSSSTNDNYHFGISKKVDLNQNSVNYSPISSQKLPSGSSSVNHQRSPYSRKTPPSTSNSLFSRTNPISNRIPYTPNNYFPATNRILHQLQTTPTSSFTKPSSSVHQSSNQHLRIQQSSRHQSNNQHLSVQQSSNHQSNNQHLRIQQSSIHQLPAPLQDSSDDSDVESPSEKALQHMIRKRLEPTSPTISVKNLKFSLRNKARRRLNFDNLANLNLLADAATVVSKSVPKSGSD